MFLRAWLTAAFVLSASSAWASEAAPNTCPVGVPGASATLDANGFDLHLDSLPAGQTFDFELEFPGAKLPPIAYANQFGVQEIPNPEACDTVEALDDKDACKQWFHEQVTWRARLKTLFRIHYAVTPQGFTLQRQGEKGLEKFPSNKASSVKPGPNGSLDVHVALADLPATVEHPLKHANVYAGVGKAKKQQSCALASPIDWDTAPPMLARFATVQDVVGDKHALFYDPGAPVVRGHFFENEHVGYQYQPKEKRPAEQNLDLTFRKVDGQGEAEVYAGPDGSGAPALWSFVGGKPVAMTPVGDGKTYGPAVRDGVRYTLFTSNGTMSTLGTGACGACDTVRLWLVSLDGKGHMKELVHATFTPANGVGLADGENCHAVDESADVLSVEPGLKKFALHFDCQELKEDGSPKGKPHHLEASWTWDDAKKAYVAKASPGFDVGWDQVH